MEWVKLTKVTDDIEFEMVKGLLEMGNIPVIREVKGTDGYLQIIIGKPLAGINVMVPKDKYDEALQLLNSRVDEEFLK